VRGLVVHARGLVKTYGRGNATVRILDGADLDVARGELIAVVGRSGSGKSTLLHVLGGLDVADAGLIEVAGTRVDGAPDRALVALRRHKVGFVFQSFHLLPELTGLENVLLPTRLVRDRNGAVERASRLVEDLGLSEPSRRLPETLSGGEQQRLAIVRALVNDPPLVLADEPTGNLDEEAGAAVLALLRQVADQGRGVVLVTHEAQAARLADRVLHLRHGRLVG
jgi:ABC-type lipoprotein export system ATPase subunit